MTAPAILLGVNIDHVATVRQARRARVPDPVEAARVALASGADNITLHLREDRRHIQLEDVHAVRALPNARMNLEMAVTDETLAIARAVRPPDCCLVPERRLEVTTEGGLDAAGQVERLREAAASLAAAGVRVALFIDPDLRQIDAAAKIGAPVVELHTGAYAESAGPATATELERLRAGARHAASLGIEVHAGHGLDYRNVQPVAAIAQLVELNIGHAIVSRAIFAGFASAVRDMKSLLLAARA
jgi:pyridoxine 5-phosphate synthase